MTIQEVFNQKLTENGDISFITTGDFYLDILFQTEYYQKHIDEINIGQTDFDKLFSMFIRDPRFGLGRRDLGRILMSLSQLSPEDIIKAGRFDDIYQCLPIKEAAIFFKKEIDKNNQLAKKWAPRYASKNLSFARAFAQLFNMNKQQYGHYIKCDTTENKLSRHRTEDINFEHVPSLALIKYYSRFKRGEDTGKRFAQYLNDVQDGKKEMKIATTTVYDIYRNRTKIDPDLFFDKLEKIAIDCIPIVDTSGSMQADDAMGKALSIGHYLAKCSTCCPNQVITFSSNPHFITLGENRVEEKGNLYSYGGYMPSFIYNSNKSKYQNEIDSMHTGDCSNTNFEKVLDLLKQVSIIPKYLVVLSDMEFDSGAHQSKESLQALWKKNNIDTKIVWWNFNNRNKTVPEMDSNGNIYLSGYNPMLLKFLQTGFDGKKFLQVLITEYLKKLS